MDSKNARRVRPTDHTQPGCISFDHLRGDPPSVRSAATRLRSMKGSEPPGASRVCRPVRAVRTGTSQLVATLVTESTGYIGSTPAPSDRKRGKPDPEPHRAPPFQPTHRVLSSTRVMRSHHQAFRQEHHKRARGSRRREVNARGFQAAACRAHISRGRT